MTNTLLPFTEHGSGNTILLFLHFFGSSQCEWRPVVERLGSNHHCVAADMPGFGAAADIPGYTVTAMAEHVRALLAHFAPTPVTLVAHSFSGKPAMILAADPPANLKQVVLVAPTTLVPEPISADARDKMRQRNSSRAGAEAFIKGSHYRPLDGSDEAQAIADVLRANKEAWLAWPDHGSLEDWSQRVTALQVRTDLIVGDRDEAIPLPFQREHTLPLIVSTGGRLVVIEDAAHMLPCEATAELVMAMEDLLLP